MKHNYLNFRSLFKIVGIGILSFAIVGCGVSNSATKNTNENIIIKDADLANVEKTSTRTYGMGEKTKDGMRVNNSDGTYTYCASDVDMAKLRKTSRMSIYYSDEAKVYKLQWYINNALKDNGITFTKTEDNVLVGIRLRILINDKALDEYKSNGILPANATKKNVREMVEKELQLIKAILQRNIKSDAKDTSNKYAKLAYEYKKRGYYMDLSDKKRSSRGTAPAAVSYINNVVETWLIDLDNGDFSAGVNFNIGSPKWNASEKGIQILSQRYGFDNLFNGTDVYNTDIHQTRGIINAMMKRCGFVSDEWIRYGNQTFHGSDKTNRVEEDDELYMLEKNNK